MKSIEGFLGKFRGRAATQIQNHILIVEIIKKHTGVELEMKDVKISSGELVIHATSALKNEIFIKKNLILKEISQKIQKIRISDIR
ncbi:MAG: hypothetical protein Q8Q03_03035 [bacterium]|nr:hypothetical protein [bacterium]